MTTIHLVVRSCGSCAEDAYEETLKAFYDPVKADEFIEACKMKDARMQEIADHCKPLFYEFAKQQVYPRDAELVELAKADAPERRKAEWKARYDEANHRQSIALEAWSKTRFDYIEKLMDDFGCTTEEKNWYMDHDGPVAGYWKGFHTEQWTYFTIELELE